MIRILYLSQSAPGLTKKQIQDILEASRLNNLDLGITGLLIHGGGLFMQILEGPEHNVFRKYVKIQADRRHADCQIIHVSPIEERMFSKWAMGVIHSDPLQFQSIARLRETRFEWAQSNEYKAAMADFIRMLQ